MGGVKWAPMHSTNGGPVGDSRRGDRRETQGMLRVGGQRGQDLGQELSNPAFDLVAYLAYALE